jgi:thiamine-monophosphate kinase
MKTTLIEHALIETLVKDLPRSPDQLHGLQESDAELVRLPGSPAVLALTTDTLAEEMESGLYSDPYQIGWMTVLVNISDLAAVGADPIGILLSMSLPTGADDAFIVLVRAGIRDACAAARVSVLGGDTNFASRPQMGATAVGLIPDGKVLTRRGCRPGDLVLSSGYLGDGATFAFHKMLSEGGDDTMTFLPRPRIEEGRLIRRYATACIDTSDGMLAALDQLSRLNGLGFTVEAPVARFLHPGALFSLRSRCIPEWLALAGPHGEFELLFTLPAARSKAFLEEAARIGWTPLHLGKVSVGGGVRMHLDGVMRSLDTGKIRNLFHEVGGDPARYLKELMNIHGALSARPGNNGSARFVAAGRGGMP